MLGKVKTFFEQGQNWSLFKLAKHEWLTEFAKGLFHACQLFGVTLIGGDTTRSERLVLSISAQGLLAADTPAIYRSGAQVGDKVYVSGTLGDGEVKRPEGVSYLSDSVWDSVSPEYIKA